MNTYEHFGDASPNGEPSSPWPCSMRPDGENWDYLVRSLSVLENDAAEEVVKALRTVRVATDDPMAIRQLILLGIRAAENDGSFENVEKLLEHWTGLTRPEQAGKQTWLLGNVGMQKPTPIAHRRLGLKRMSHAGTLTSWSDT